MEDNRREPGRSDDKQQPRRGQFWPVLIIVVLAFLLVRNLVGSSAYEDIDYNLFVRELKNNNISSVEVNKKTKLAVGEFEVAPTKQATGEDEEDPGSYSKKFSVELPDNYDELLQPYADGPESSDISIRYTNNDAAEWFTLFMLFGVPLILILVIWLMFRRTRDQIMGGGGFLSSFSRSTAKRYEPSDKQTTFKDVAGLEGVKADLQEIVDFLKAPEKFQRLGGRIPKGVLLNGPPGTGKTLLARAVAGEAGVPFYSVNGSEFIQMFVGVGASRVRDLFQTAKENAPAIIFVDEIDAVGRQRGAGLGGGHDEREQTLNQILGEMDGFSGVDSVIVVAATNRPDVLDPALLRPGRFDRHVTVGRPTYKGRHEIFKVHTRDVPLDHDVDLKRLAAVTIGLTGADIRNVVNEAALWAARNDRRRVHMEDFDYARDKVLMGAKREELLKQDEKEKTAYHEAGHTLAAWYLKGAQRVHKVTIIPRGRSLGSTQIIPTEDRVSSSEQELLDQLVVLLAGRAAEKIIYDEGTVGAENDLERATSMARRMVTHWGMSPKLGPVSYKTSDEDPFLGREMHQSRQFSEHTQEMIDDEVSRILNDASQRALDLLNERKAELESLTKQLLAEEELGEQQIEDLIGQSVHGPASSFLAFSNGDEPSDESDGESADGKDQAEASAESTSDGSNGEAGVDQADQAKKDAEAPSSAAGVPSGNEANRVEPGDATS